MILAFTGHRPQKLGGYSDDTFNRLVALAKAVITKYHPMSIITGMALGWDQAVAQAAIELHVPFTAAIPFIGQESKWPEQSQAKYRELRGKSELTKVVMSGDYSADKMQIRNEWMVDHADMVIALWDGTSGGTANCVNYAKAQHKQIVNVWASWVKHK